MITLTIDWSEIEERLGRTIDLLEHREAIHALAAEVLLDNNLERQRDAVDPDGEDWADYSDITLLAKGGSGRMLVGDGPDHLLASVHSSSSSEQAEVGTNLDHPKVFTHQYGAHIKPVRASMLRVPMGSNSGAIFLKEATIPARPYIGIGPDDGEEVMEAIITLLSDD